MKISLLQTDIRWADPEANRQHTQALLDDCTDADIVILPEMFTTGFCMRPQGIAEEAGTQTLSWMREAARAKNAAIAGSVSTVENGRFYNRFHFVTPDGGLATYDKRHLFSFAGEHREYTAGTERVIVEFRGVRILLQICYDLRFPVFSRNRGDYDMAIYVANWPEVRVDAWSALLRARAIENVCYVAGVNRTGSDAEGNSYNGRSVLLGFRGNTLAAPATDGEEVVTGEIDMNELAAFRGKFPALDDADDFTLHI